MDHRARVYSFYDRLHSNIAQCSMLTRQHGSPKDRESLPYREQGQGERTSVPSSGLGDDPRATAHRGGMVLRANETASWLMAGARASLPTAIQKTSLTTRRLASSRRVGCFRSIINVETGRA
ncbi:hypothetical protein FXB40_40085 [Bradyrhizobium rifense]|uniref:Uncharacterized protein n=1 Tax=Bradyrhizobium rifense TaxID=515499 RepID=A0A5D3KD77_9BRAD|nr:hypothetical protein FXB40_40085 [Bradyrhizobium rifense]